MLHLRWSPEQHLKNAKQQQRLLLPRLTVAQPLELHLLPDLSEEQRKEEPQHHLKHDHRAVGEQPDRLAA